MLSSWILGLLKGGICDTMSMGSAKSLAGRHSIESLLNVPVVVILSVPSTDRGTRTNLAGAAIAARDPRRWGRRSQRWSVNT